MWFVKQMCNDYHSRVEMYANKFIGRPSVQGSYSTILGHCTDNFI